MGIVWGAEGPLWLNPVQQARGTELLFILWRAQDGAWHWTQTRQAARGHHTYPNMCVCACVYACVWACVLLLCRSPGMLTHQLAVTELSMKCSGCDQIWQPVLLAFAAPQKGCEVPRWWTIMCCSKLRSGASGKSCLAGRGSADYVGTGLLALCSHCWVETTGDSISIVPLSPVLTSAHSEVVWFCALLCVWQRVKEYRPSKEMLTSKSCQNLSAWSNLIATVPHPCLA